MTHDEAEAAALAALLAPEGAPLRDPLPAPAEVERWVDARLEAMGIERPAPLTLADLDADEGDDPRELLYFLLRMAAHTYARRRDPLPPVDPALLGALEALLATRPRADEAYCQMPIDAESTLRRALAALEHARAHPGPILAVGDDDAVTLALALLGARDLHALDVDDALLAFLEAGAASAGGRLTTHRVDLFEGALPEELADACSVVLTDPVRSYGPCLAFLDVSASCLRPGDAGLLLWADHPDWNFELDRVLAALPRLGLEHVFVRERFHRYPITETWVPDPAEKARALGLDEGFLRDLVRHTRALTHLYGLRRAR
jgi:hypothetical protein